ncbi:hypothetical protein ACEW7V_01025 [Areca yellow leaf disease phytoplasma]|uniref:glutamine amidotransferase-related protein n=1 Tax=Areca yellow leaf disease phytoplasma TaxID=927614 RepID=UPI0035B55318
MDPHYVALFEKNNDFICFWNKSRTKLCEIIELSHHWFIAVQFHPEFFVKTIFIFINTF